MCSRRVTRSMPAVKPLVAGKSCLRLVTICPVGVWVVDTTGMVRSGLHLSRFLGSVALRMSKPRYRSARPSEILFEPLNGAWVILMYEITAPPFCARPVWSKPITCLPSRRAARASVATTVTEPVPPIPITWMPKPRLSSTLLVGTDNSCVKAGTRPFFFFGAPSLAGTGLGVRRTMASIPPRWMSPVS